jgi:DNA-binding CsgD family transcriptional regulator
MSGDSDSSHEGEQEWRPDRTEDYADGPVLSDRQAETIATLDATDSRASTAAILGIAASTVDSHQRDAQARTVAAIHQLRQLLENSETIRQAVETELGHVEPLVAESDHSESAFPNLSTEDMVDWNRVNPRLLDTPVVEQDLDAFEPPEGQFISQQPGTDPTREIVQFLRKHEDAKEIEVVVPTAGENTGNADDLDVIASVSLDEISMGWERHDVAELLAEQIAERGPDLPVVFRRVE